MQGKITGTGTESNNEASKRIKEVTRYLDTLLKHWLPHGVDYFRFEPNRALEIRHEGRLQSIEKIQLTIDLVDIFIRHVIAHNVLKPIEEIEEHDIRTSTGVRLNYEIVISLEQGHVRHPMEAALFETPGGLGLELTRETPFTLSYPSPVRPSALEDDELERWMDDFATRLINKEEPKPRDVIFNPNKRHPYVTLTGGVKPVDDVLIEAGLTRRIAHLLIRKANNPRVNNALEKNGGVLEGMDIDLAYRTHEGRRFRVNIADSFDLVHDHAPLITMRILPPKPWTTDDLPLPHVILDTVMKTRMGLVLISGTTGSGKSTTMGVIIDYLLRRKSINLLTIENPIETMFPAHEYPRSLITQRELGKHTLALSRGLESAVRQTLNMAMVGEIRNADDAIMALELAQSGHLIFATVHAGTTGESVRRIVDMFPASQEKKIREMLASQYKLGLAQILVKGTQGQTELVMEIMKTNPEIKLFILNQQEPDRLFSMRELLELYSSTQHTQSMDQALVSLYKNGRISEDVMMYNSPDPSALVYRQTKLGIRLSARWDATGAQIVEDTSGTLTLAPTLH